MNSFHGNMSRSMKIKENIIRIALIIVGWGLLLSLTTDITNPIITKEFIFLAAAIVIANCIPLDLGYAQITQAFAFEYLALMLLGPVSAAWITVTGILGQGVRGRKKDVSWYLLNSAIQVISILAAGVVFMHLGGKALLDSRTGITNPAFLLPIFGGAITHFCFNIGMVYPLLIVRHGKSINIFNLYNVLKWDFLAKLIFAPLAFYIYISYDPADIVELAAPLVFMIGLWIFMRKSIELSVTKRELDDNIDRITAQREIAIAANSSLDMKFVIKTVAERIRDMYKCELSAVHICNETGLMTKPSAVNEGENNGMKCLLCGFRYKKLLKSVLTRNRPFLTSDPKVIGRMIESSDCEFNENCSPGSIAIYPLCTESNKIGTLTLMSKDPEIFSGKSKEIIDFIAQELSGAVANARLHEDLKREYNERNEELTYAARVQAEILPHDFMTERVRIGTRFTAARYLGGDFFEIATRSDGMIGIAVGDVSGKGVPAALTMMRIVSIIRQLSREAHTSIDVLNKLNRELDWESSEDDSVSQYATCFFMMFDPVTGLMRYSSAGHVRPYLFEKETGEIRMLSGGGFPLGMFPEGNFNEDEVFLNPGDKIIMYTDGATDIVDEKGKRFTAENLFKLVHEICMQDDEETAAGIHRSLMTFKSNAALADDVAIVSLEYLGGPVDELAEMEAMIKKNIPVMTDVEAE